MSNEQPPLKSALQIAMERLRKSDEQAGIQSQPLTDEQKAAISEIRNFYQAKIAEQEVLHQSRVRRTADPAQRTALEDEWRHERERLSSERDTKIEKVRSQLR